MLVLCVCQRRYDCGSTSRINFQIFGGFLIASHFLQADSKWRNNTYIIIHLQLTIIDPIGLKHSTKEQNIALTWKAFSNFVLVPCAMFCVGTYTCVYISEYIFDQD